MNKKLKFIGATKEQIGWGSNDDPNRILEIGNVYEMKRAEVHSWHTKIELVEFPGMMFNGACFEIVKE